MLLLLVVLFFSIVTCIVVSCLLNVVSCFVKCRAGILDDCNLPILEIDTSTGLLEVVSVDRYTAATRDLGVYIDPNLLWEVSGVDINCICRLRCPPENALSVVIVKEY